MSAKPVIQIPDSTRLELNRLQTDLQSLLAEATKQQNAKVPGMDAAITRCTDCLERIADFKAINFPNRK
jgi:hypothetical protein